MKTCNECGATTKVVTCARCREPINALTEDYRSAVPGLGNLCVGCHGDWLEDREFAAEHSARNGGIIR